MSSQLPSRAKGLEDVDVTTAEPEVPVDETAKSEVSTPRRGETKEVVVLGSRGKNLPHIGWIQFSGSIYRYMM